MTLGFQNCRPKHADKTFLVLDLRILNFPRNFVEKFANLI